MTVFGEELFRRTPFKFWALAPLALLGLAAFTFPFDGDAWRRGTILACDAALVLLLLSLWPYHRIPYVRRALAALVAAAYAVYVAAALLPGGSAHPVPALLGFLVIGRPSLLYALLGRFHLRLEPLAIDPDDPLMTRAVELARASLPRMRELCARGLATLVHFPFDSRPAEGDGGDERSETVRENLWGEVLELSAASARVRVVTPPHFHCEPVDVLDVPIAKLLDWETELEDGSIEGGFATRAMAAVSEREGLDVPPWIAKRLGRYRSDAELLLDA